MKQAQLQDVLASLECVKRHDLAGAVDLTKDAIDLTSTGSPSRSRSPSPRRGGGGAIIHSDDGGNVAKMIRRIGEVTAKNVSLLRNEAGMQLEITNLKLKYEREVKEKADATKKVRVLNDKLASLQAQNDYSKKVNVDKTKALEEQKARFLKMTDDCQLSDRLQVSAENKVAKLESELTREREGRKEQTKQQRQQLQMERERLSYTRENRLTEEKLHEHLSFVSMSLREMQASCGAQFADGGREFERFAAMYMALAKRYYTAESQLAHAEQREQRALEQANALAERLPQRPVLKEGAEGALAVEDSGYTAAKKDREIDANRKSIVILEKGLEENRRIMESLRQHNYILEAKNAELSTLYKTEKKEFAEVDKKLRLIESTAELEKQQHASEVEEGVMRRLGRWRDDLIEKVVA